MSILQVSVFVLLASFILLKGLAKPQRFLEYPYFMAATFVVFIFPQIISLQRFPGTAPLESLTPVMVMTNLCLACCYFGYLLPPSQWIAKHGSTPVNLDRLFHVGVVFIFVSFFFNILISQMTYEERGGTMATGRVTIYLFFSGLVYPGLSISMLTAMARRSSVAWLFVGLAMIIPIQSIILAGRREGAALFVLTIALTLFYHKRFAPPRIAVVIGLAFAMVAIPATGTYRGAMSTGGFDAVKQINLVENFDRFLNEEAILELRNAAVLIYVTAQRADYEFGTGYWDQLVFRFVPAQIVGSELKESLMFGKLSSDSGGGEDETEIGTRTFKRSKGSTVTGMGDSFKQFGYFGCLFFALLAVIFRSLWETSLQPNTFFAKLLYIQTSTSAMRAVTHQTVDYFPGLLYYLVFLGFAVLYARIPRKQRGRASPAPLLVNPGGKGSVASGAIPLPTSPVPDKPIVAPARRRRDLSELE